MNFMDYCFITILLLCGFAGMYQGLFRSIIGIASIILTFFISINYYHAFAAIIKTKTPIYNWLKHSIESNIDTNIRSMPGVDTLLQLNDTVINGIVDKIYVPPVLRTFVLNSFHFDIHNINIFQFVDALSTRWADVFINIMAFIVLFAGLQLLFTLLQNLFGAIVQVPILHEVNYIGGFLLGLLQGVVVLYVICLGWSMLSGSPMYKEVFVDLAASKYAKLFYNNNLLLDILVKYKII